ncbi:hypothetical protein MLD38_015530 [Melastoma candidum]|uniref:Uncharacterized protein n=1 Tax=Melastoma candidum TaxID=119954 RepID=A0ACB9RGA3_9MYRT|nr:hypothetical protein MLD38_015530 [Melastoma candidum]
MQRQSLGGSPLSRLPQPLPSASSSSSSSPPSPSLHLYRNRDKDPLDDEKAAKSPSKPRRFSTSSSSSPPSPPSPLPQHQKFIHAIPLLTILCFLVLFLFSHDPSPSDLAQFKGLKRAPDLTGTTNNADAGDGGGGGEAVEVEVEVGSWRNLQGSNKSRINRKFADF